MPAKAVILSKRDRTALELCRPILRAYLLVYLSTSAPRLVSLTIAALRRRIAIRDALEKAAATVHQSSGIDRFPAGAALFIAGSTLGPRLLGNLVSLISTTGEQSNRSARRLQNAAATKFIAAFLSAATAFKLLNMRLSMPLPTSYSYNASDEQSFASKQRREGRLTRPRRTSSVAFGSAPPPVDASKIPPLAGRTMDLTTFGLVHASVVLASSLLERSRSARPGSGFLTQLSSMSEKYAAPSVFILSSSIIMWAWFYTPDRLPRSYNSWITRAAELDPRILEALRQCRYGNFIYGKDTGMGPLLGTAARELGLPEEWGEPAKVIPVPCQLYHGGISSCEVHGLSRFFQGFQFAMRMYLPLNLIMLLRKERSKRSPARSIITAAQSSVFLGSFISFFYYGVCLGRNRLGPRIIGTDVASRQIIDGGICVAVGCLACGFSILTEMEARRVEMALFVAPRALSSLLPRRYDRKYMWREQLAFAFSAAIIVTAAQTRPEKVKGVFGTFLAQALR